MLRNRQPGESVIYCRVRFEGEGIYRFIDAALHKSYQHVRHVLPSHLGHVSPDLRHERIVLKAQRKRRDEPAQRY